MTAPGLREAAQHLRDRAAALEEWDDPAQASAVAEDRAVAALLEAVDEEADSTPTPVYQAAFAVAVAVTGQPKGAGDDE